MNIWYYYLNISQYFLEGNVMNDINNNNNKLVDKLIEVNHKLYFSDIFLEQMSRNVRGPLYSIIEFSKIALETGNDETAIKHYLDKISHASHLMNESMDDVMAMRQIAMKNVSLHPELVNLDEFLKSLKNDMANLLDPTGIELIIEKKELENCYINADYTILFQILRKMIRVITEMMPRKNVVHLEIQSNGCVNNNIDISFKVYGKDTTIMSSKLQALKDEFAAIEYDMYSSLESMDPTITIIRFYAHEMGTDVVEATSNPEEGSSVQLSIKFPIVSVGEYSAKVNRKFDFSQKRILVADDDEINLEIIDKLLRAKGAEVITVRDGREALLTYRAEHGKFDLILLDIVMPDIDGLSVAKQIRDNTTIPSSRKVPIIAMTVNAFHENYEQSLKAGMNSHLVKPVDSGRLYNTVAEYI